MKQRDALAAITVRAVGHRMTTVERLVVLLADVRAEREEGTEHHLILDDVESVLAAILAAEPNAPTLAEILRKVTGHEQG
jgi:hypothetical protein